MFSSTREGGREGGRTWASAMSLVACSPALACASIAWEMSVSNAPDRYPKKKEEKMGVREEGREEEREEGREGRQTYRYRFLR